MLLHADAYSTGRDFKEDVLDREKVFQVEHFIETAPQWENQDKSLEALVEQARDWLADEGANSK